MISKVFVESHIKIDEESGCWIWTGTLNNAGYPQAGSDGKWVAVHREVKVLYDGHEWQPKQMADHTCRTKQCVNPQHIRVTNRAVNQYHRGDFARGSMAKRRLRVARDLHDSLPERYKEKTG